MTSRNQAEKRSETGCVDDHGALKGFKERLDEWIGCYCNGDVLAFAEATNISVSSLRGYLRNDTLPNLPAFCAICATGADPHYLLFGEKTPERGEQRVRLVLSIPEAIAILGDASFDTHLRAVSAYEESGLARDILRIEVSEEWEKDHGFVENPPFFVIQSSGNMEHSICRGDIVAIDPSCTIPDDRIYLVSTPHEHGFRRITPSGSGGVSLISDNPAYPASTLGEDEVDELRTYGRAVYVWSGRSA